MKAHEILTSLSSSSSQNNFLSFIPTISNIEKDSRTSQFIFLDDLSQNDEIMISLLHIIEEEEEMKNVRRTSSFETDENSILNDFDWIFQISKQIFYGFFLLYQLANKFHFFPFHPISSSHIFITKRNRRSREIDSENLNENEMKKVLIIPTGFNYERNGGRNDQKRRRRISHLLLNQFHEIISLFFNSFLSSSSNSKNKIMNHQNEGMEDIKDGNYHLLQVFDFY